MTHQQRSANERRERRMREAIARETPAERRERLTAFLAIAESNPRWATQADMLRAALRGGG